MFRSLIQTQRIVTQNCCKGNARFLSSATKVDSALLKKLQNEIKYEISENPVELDGFQSQFKALGWTVIEKSASKEVSIKKEIGNERITAIFGTDSLEDTEDFGGEENVAENAPESANEEEDQDDTPIAVSIIIEKVEKPGALEIATTVQSSAFYIDSLGFHSSKDLANDETAEGDWKRRGAYTGPPFNNLDEEVIETFHDFIEKRGFDSNLADLISDYLVEKEQKEYVNWLKNVSDFIE